MEHPAPRMTLPPGTTGVVTGTFHITRANGKVETVHLTMPARMTPSDEKVPSNPSQEQQ